MSGFVATETIRRTAVVLLCACLVGACGDSPNKEAGESGSEGPRQESPTEKTESAWKPRCTAIADSDSWRLHVTLPGPLPDGAEAALLRASSGEASIELELPGRPQPFTFQFPRSSSEYRVTIVDDRSRSFTREASFE